MATIKPFAALRPRPELAEKICELPYDVMSSEEARRMAAGNPLSFLHVSKPEIDLDRQISLYDDRVYAQGRKSFLSLISYGHLRRGADYRPSQPAGARALGKNPHRLLQAGSVQPMPHMA